MTNGDVQPEIEIETTPRDANQKPSIPKIKRREKVQAAWIQHMRRPRVDVTGGSLRDHAISQCKRDRSRDIEEHVEDLVGKKRWGDIVNLFRCLKDTTLYEHQDLEEQIRNVIKEATSAGEFDSVVDLSEILISLLPEHDLEREVYEKDRERYNSLIDGLTNFDQELNANLWTPEMRVIDCIIEGNLRELPNIVRETAISVSGALEILEHVNENLTLLNKERRIFLPEVEKKSGLGRYLTRFLLRRWTSKGYVSVG